MSQNLVLKFILLNFTKGFIPLHVTAVFYVAASSDTRRTDAGWYLNQAEIKHRLSLHSSSALSSLCHPFWLIRGCLWAPGLWLQYLIQEHHSTKVWNAHFTRHNNNWMCQWGQKHNWPSLMLEGSSGLVSVMNSRGIYSCLAVPKSTIAFWLHFQLWV